MALLFLAETVDFSVIVIELLLGARDPLLGGSKIDGILIVIRLHKKFLRLSISRNGGIGSAAKWAQ